MVENDCKIAPLYPDQFMVMVDNNVDVRDTIQYNNKKLYHESSSSL